MAKPIDKIEETARCPYCIKDDMKSQWSCEFDGHRRWDDTFCTLSDLQRCPYSWKMPNRGRIHEITNLLVRRVVGEASKKIISGSVITQFNKEADDQIIALSGEK